jgi:hypothetical protein
MNTKPTPGPWKISKNFPGSTATFREVEDPRGRVVLVGQSGLKNDLPADSNAALIVAAVNACFAVNPDNPMAVAEAMPEVVDVMRGILKCGMTTTADDNTWRRIRSALAKLEAKVDDDHLCYTCARPELHAGRIA